MPDESKGKSFPDVSAKLSALPKKSLFERQKAEAEAKRAREKAETAAVYEEFVKSFEDEDSVVPQSLDGGSNTFRGRGGGPPRRHFAASSSRGSGHGHLGPPPPSLSHKRSHETFPPSRRDHLKFENMLTPSEADRVLDEEERAAPKPTLYLASLPPGTSPSVIKSLIPSTLTVDNVKIIKPPGQLPSHRESSSALVTLTSDSAASNIETAVSTLQNKYLGLGYYLTLCRHLSSTSINSNMPLPIGLPSTTTSLPFGAKPIPPSSGTSLSRAPPPGPHRGGIPPPSSYGSTVGRNRPTTQVQVELPTDIRVLRQIHKTIEQLVKQGPGFEALLMSRPEVQTDEKWAWLFDPRSPGGVYYRWKLWQIITDPKKKNIDKPAMIFEGGPIWLPPKQHLKFENVTRMEQFVSHPDYDSSDEEHSDGEDDRRNIAGAPPDGANTHSHDPNFLNPLKMAKLTHLLARLPTTHSKLRRGDVVRLTAFAIDHAASGASEVVDMAIRNVFRPLAYTGANPHRELETSTARLAITDNDNLPPSDELLDQSSAKLVGLYIISDILSSSATSGVRHAWRYRQLFENALRSRKVFEHLGRLDKDLKWGRLKAEKWKRSVGVLLHLWEGWCCFTQLNQEHFTQVFENPPPTEAELQKQKETEKAHADQAAVAFAKSKSRWKTVDDERGGKFDPTGPANENKPFTSVHAVDESMHGMEGTGMETSDLKTVDGKTMLKAPPSGDEDTQTEIPQLPQHPPQHPTQSDKSEESAGQQEPETRRRKPRPKAEDMFASDSE
ncbi:hypothetical protein LT330_003138 [Penicillium expansum]|uniref:RNA polymerase II, large subunit, CTD n=1 Tax=Penicillium expansum TaxID=27334 RepID=A0A0A2J262_PENEN|nr:RNA polymerase II, large subunit, CTD [Penicillium expansum]KAK4862000.1 hypothetical protein LT330_003138 [Penicillium expansum]KGO46485.1 RNA polymerase II, large subunit, CTD [Penicillium expansum]KGO50240.1 RNA polymerase II, large subunit, CTD [Penicillium expansum]KGO67540.1 RNA polymerase II, large subunit, CTD [Penicillium expansum]